MQPTEIEERLIHELDKRKHQQISIDGFLPAAVLVPILISESGYELLFTVRSNALNHHAGQIAFPGGKLDPDESTDQAAVREMQEEIGIIPSQIIGRLDQQPSPAGFIVTPIVATVAWPQSVCINTAEVKEIFTVPLDQLTQLTPHKKTRTIHQQKRTIYFYNYNGREIWGLTANIMRNLLNAIEQI